ncbi:MAG: antitoxin [Oscillospiraceae bacterium]|nr:antitoxin [Oscillospiraceae bacterium]
MSKTSSAVKNRYNAKAYDRITTLVKKGEKEKIKAHAEKLGKSLNAYMNDLIKEDMSESE